MSDQTVLVVDDDQAVRSSICLNLEQASYLPQAAANAAQALEALAQQTFQIVICDLRMPDLDGIQFVERCRQINPDISVVMMSGFGGTDVALQALRAGAQDYISKPFAIEDLILILKKVEERERVRTQPRPTESSSAQKYNFSNIIAHSQGMRDIFETVKRLAGFNTTVLITGESGTGKELIARAIHHNSPRRGKPFIAINCGAIPENLMESELFGHKKGSFTDATRDKKGLFEEASGGTIFLDEIGEMPAHLQVKLLRALQEQQIRRVGDEQNIDIDVRVVAATLRDLEEDVINGRFRDDLYYRLNVVSMHLPALRERQEDIPVLVQYFMKKHNKKLGLSIKLIQPDALQTIVAYPWRGNVRELENCIERALVLTDTDSIDIQSLPPQVRNFGKEPEHDSSLIHVGEDNLSIKQRTKALEVDLIRRALKKTNGNRTHAAKVLEISHRALLYKLKEYGLEKISK